MDPEAAAHYPRSDECDAERITADRGLPEAVRAVLAAGGPLDTVEHGVLPVNFACPDCILTPADGGRTGVSDAMSPWSAALAQA